MIPVAVRGPYFEKCTECFEGLELYQHPHPLSAIIWHFEKGSGQKPQSIGRSQFADRAAAAVLVFRKRFLTARKFIAKQQFVSISSAGTLNGTCRLINFRAARLSSVESTSERRPTRRNEANEAFARSPTGHVWPAAGAGRLKEDGILLQKRKKG